MAAASAFAREFDGMVDVILGGVDIRDDTGLLTSPFSSITFTTAEYFDRHNVALRDGILQEQDSTIEIPVKAGMTVTMTIISAIEDRLKGRCGCGFIFCSNICFPISADRNEGETIDGYSRQSSLSPKQRKKEYPTCTASDLPF